MHSFEVSLGYESVDSASLKMYFGQRFHTPMKLKRMHSILKYVNKKQSSIY